jgi:hypothetical protein
MLLSLADARHHRPPQDAILRARRRAAGVGGGVGAAAQFSFGFGEGAAPPELAPGMVAQDVVAKELAVREMALRSRADGADQRFTAWRGRSGRRYVATAYPIDSVEALSFEDAVLLAVSADRRLLGRGETGPFGGHASVMAWREAMRAAGAVEVHVHLIAATTEDRQRALADLDPAPAASH